MLSVNTGKEAIQSLKDVAARQSLEEETYVGHCGIEEGDTHETLLLVDC